MKSLCIKTNNQNHIDYILNELNAIDLDFICFSCYQFKHFKNIIIHYKGNNDDLFIKKISSLLSLFVIDELEEIYIERNLLLNYFYFNTNERKEIINICCDIMVDDFSSLFDKKLTVLCNIFENYLTQNKKLFLDGFLNFRLQKYQNIIDEIVNEAVNSYIIEKEYLEFISLLKIYINSQKSTCDTIHIIYSQSHSILLNEKKEIIPTTSINSSAKYLSDISFSENDYILNSLLTLLPKKIYIHLIDNFIDDFLITLKSIFENRIHICNDCNICQIYKQSAKIKNPIV